MKWKSNSAEETLKLGTKLIETFPEARVITLRGELGSGKTHFTKGIGAQLGILTRSIKSPTFITLLSHEGKRRLHHCDFYRQENPQTFPKGWWQELLEDSDSLIVVEWPERIEPHLPSERIDVDFIQEGETERTLIITRHG